MPTPLANALAQYAPPKQAPSTPLAQALMDYASRVQGDFQHGLDESAQGFGEMVNGQLATGIPRTFLGGLGWMGSPVSGAVSPLLNPVLQPVAQGVHDYVGKPVENATGYPADLTTELALALALPKALHGAGKAVNSAVPYLASLGDAVGSRIGAPADAYLAGAIPRQAIGQSGVETGWVFKDVEHGLHSPSLSREQMRAMNQAVDAGDWTTAEVPIRQIYATQKMVNSDFAKAASNHGSDSLPLAVKVNGKIFVRDGHHRIVAAADDGAQTAKVRLVDLDGMTGAASDTTGQMQLPIPAPKSPISSPVGGDEGIIAYHGSPHTFDKFSMDKIGTGEGAQAYGHGLYFAENEGVAKTYKNAGPAANAQYDSINKRLSELASEMGKLEKPGQYRKYTDQAKGDALAAEYDRLMQSKREVGNTYQVRLNVKPHELLDWDKPLSEQPKYVQDALSKGSGPEFDRAASEYSAAYDAYMSRPEHVPAEQLAKLEQAVGDTYDRMIALRGNENLSGSRVYSDLAKNQPWNVATEKLKSAGIKGIKYKDAGSRDGSGGTYNYVIFDDKLIDILKRYGIPMTAGAGGAMMVAGQNMPPEVANQLGPQS